MARKKPTTLKLRGSNLARVYSSSSASGAENKAKRSVQADIHAPPRAVDMAKDAGLAFLDADLDGDQQLSWEEFYLCIPASIKERSSPEELHGLFASVDQDKSGYVTIDEYFMWTLNVCVQQSGGGLDTIFRRYDKDNTGYLDPDEFSQVCTDINFGQYAHEIFIELVSSVLGSSHETLAHALPHTGAKPKPCVLAG